MTGGAQGLARGATDNARSLDASVVVCTHDRADSLRVTLASLERLRGLDDLTWEVVVVDNASGDETPAVIEACARRGHLPLRPVFEPRLGHARARNAGVRAARGQVVAFTDDDVAVDPGWLRAVVEGFRLHRPGAVGGKILPAWGAPPPPWLTPDLHPVICLVDRGGAHRFLEGPHLWGANLAIRADLFERLGGFDPRLGHRGGRLFGGEEVAFLQRALDAGERLLYWPESVVYHRIPPERLRRRYFWRWSFDGGEADGAQHAASRLVGGAPESGALAERVRGLAGAARRWWGAAPRSSERVRESLTICEALGFARGYAGVRLAEFARRRRS